MNYEIHLRLPLFFNWPWSCDMSHHPEYRFRLLIHMGFIAQSYPWQHSWVQRCLSGYCWIWQGSTSPDLLLGQSLPSPCPPPSQKTSPCPPKPIWFPSAVTLPSLVVPWMHLIACLQHLLLVVELTSGADGFYGWALKCVHVHIPEEIIQSYSLT